MSKIHTVVHCGISSIDKVILYTDHPYDNKDLKMFLNVLAYTIRVGLSGIDMDIKYYITKLLQLGDYLTIISLLNSDSIRDVINSDCHHRLGFEIESDVRKHFYSETSHLYYMDVILKSLNTKTVVHIVHATLTQT